MDEETNEKTKMRPKGRRLSPLKTVIVLVMLTAVIVAAALTVSHFGGNELSGIFAGDAADFPYNSSGNPALACVGDSLASLSQLELDVYDRTGNVTFTQFMTLSK